MRAPVARLLGTLTAAAVALALAFALLFHPLVDADKVLWWAAAALALTYLAYSLLTVAHQSWGARLAGDAVQRSRIVAWREGLGLVGVVLASVVPALWGVSATAWLMAATLLLGLWALAGAPRPPRIAPAVAPRSREKGRMLAPWRDRAFVRLVLVSTLNGVATAVPATLVLFFIQDRLQGQEATQAIYLGLYFICGALSMPLWLQAVRRLGLERSWLLGMLLSVLAFVGAMGVGQGDVLLYGAVCALSGLALGSDLAMPAALLAGITARSAQGAQATEAHGLYFGWWNFASKLNLALAGGLTLPLLGWLGYTPGVRDAQGVQALTLVYCLLPCLLKLMAAGALYLFFIRTRHRSKYAN
jgi:Na+/melibiose symporter-like transporter